MEVLPTETRSRSRFVDIGTQYRVREIFPSPMTGGMANMIDGRALAAEERRVLGDRVASLAGKGRQVRLDAILTEGDAAPKSMPSGSGPGPSNWGFSSICTPSPKMWTKPRPSPASKASMPIPISTP